MLSLISLGQRLVQREGDVKDKAKGLEKVALCKITDTTRGQQRVAEKVSKFPLISFFDIDSFEIQKSEIVS